MTTTVLAYLDNTYLDVGDAIALRVGRDDRGAYIILNQTIFYPQGGGQPSDTGSIQFDQLVVSVSFVAFSDGYVLHYLPDEPANLDELVGKSCQLHLDKSRRMKHAKLHTAGHLIAGIIDSQPGTMRATKGFHFEDGPYVEFEGKPDCDADSLLSSLQAKIDILIAEDQRVTASLVSYDDLKQRCGSVPANLPEDKPLRTITIQQLDPVPCGGTHVASLAELGSVSVLKMKTRKGATKISYRVGDAQ